MKKKISETTKRGQRLMKELQKVSEKFQKDPSNDELRGKLIGKITEVGYFLQQHQAL